MAPWVVARIRRIQKAMPLAQITVAACIRVSGITMEWPMRLKIAEASSSLFSPFPFAHKQVMERPTEIAVFGMARIIW